MSSLTFGSVGDIIAVCGIIRQVVQALSDTRGSAPEYQGLDSELNSLAELLLQIGSLSKTHEKNADLKGLNKEIESCRRTLDGVRVKLSKYAANLSAKGSGNALRDTFWKLKWQTQSDRLVEARRQVNGHYIRLQSQLSVLGINLASFNAESLVARFDKTESMLLRITDAVQANKQPSGSISKTDGGTVGGVLVSGYIKSTMNAIQSVLAGLTPGPVSAISIDASFEKAASQCRKLCAAIHEECQKNNSFYRDVDFEIHLDLLSGRRLCLDGLDQPENEVEPLDPKSVKRDIFKDPTFSIATVTGDDVCPDRNDALWFQAGLATALNKPELVKKLCVSSYHDTGVYGFVFSRDSDWIFSIVDDHLYLQVENYEDVSTETVRDDAVVAYHSTQKDLQQWHQTMYQTGSGALYFSHNRDPNQTWLPLFEKAYAKAHGDYDSLRWGYPGEALEDMTGGVSTQLYTRDIIDKDRFWQEEISQLNTEVLLSVRTSNYGGYGYGYGYGSIDAPTGTPIIRTYEGYGQRLLLLRSLQSQNDVEWTGAWCNRSAEWNREWMKRLDHSFAKKNVFWISYDDLLRKYMYFDRTRIFGSQWKIAQLWAALDIAHDEDSQDPNFVFTLHREGLVVICLSQLDERYYNGLNGGYYFQLHFHLFRDGEDQYIIHSRGNYDAARSVSSELHLVPGKYTVRLKISATRYPESLSLAEVIKRNSKNKRSKLMQLGSHYDVAHAKGLGFAALRTKHAQREREAAEMKRKTQEKKAKEQGTKSEDKSEEDGDDDPDQWNAICVAGLKVYSYDPELQLELRQHPALDLTTNGKSAGGSGH